jgi:hypothetical protein
VICLIVVDIAKLIGADHKKHRGAGAGAGAGAGEHGELIVNT